MLGKTKWRNFYNKFFGLKKLCLVYFENSRNIIFQLNLQKNENMKLKLNKYQFKFINTI